MAEEAITQLIVTHGPLNPSEKTEAASTTRQTSEEQLTKEGKQEVPEETQGEEGDVREEELAEEREMEGDEMMTGGKKSRREKRKEKKKKEKKQSTMAVEEEKPAPKESQNVPETVVTTATKTNIAGVHKLDKVTYQIDKGFVPNMKVPAKFYVNDALKGSLFEELKQPNIGGFLPATKQLCNVASLPGIVGYSLGLPDIHSGYGFAIGNVAAFDMDDPKAIVSPGGVGFDINCGVRVIRTNLHEKDIKGSTREQLAQMLFDAIPVGVGSEGVVKISHSDLDRILNDGIDWAVEKGYAWPEDKEHCEEHGRMADADAKKVSDRAKQRGKMQLGTLGAGNHYLEVQVVEEIFDNEAANAMGITEKGQIVVFLHCGSRGLGHQVATDSLTYMEKAMSRDKIKLNDRQLACARIGSEEGQNYLRAMAAAANYAWVNRQIITHLTRSVFSRLCGRSPKDLGMHLIYDVCHNIAKIEDHVVDGQNKKLLVHRKGSTRAFPPHHPLIPKDYQEIGQPALIGGTMGTYSYIVTGTDKGMKETFGSTCHGAGRALSRHKSRQDLSSDAVMQQLKSKGISIRVGSKKLIMEEAPMSYKDVNQVIETCHEAGISKKAVLLKPIVVIKG